MDKVGLIIGTLGLLWTIYGVWSSSRLKKHLLAEKDMIKDKVLDIRASLQKYQNILMNDKKIQKDETLNTIRVRIEDFETSIDVLDRFKEQLEKMK